MIRRPPRSTLDRSSAASDVYKRQVVVAFVEDEDLRLVHQAAEGGRVDDAVAVAGEGLSLIHISEPTRPY